MRDATDYILKDLLREQRSARFWKNFRFFFSFIFIVFFGFILLGHARNSSEVGDLSKGYVALVRLDGMIGPGEDFSARAVLPTLASAFADRDAKGVVLDINSGGGTPVQAAIIHDAILRLKKQYHKKVVVVGEDMLASGAYYVAAAADKIYVNENSLTGSIGVIMKDFGYVDLIKKLGVERRVYTAGVNKDRLDPFMPQKPADVAKIHQVIEEVHGNFQDVVLASRKGKLHGAPDVLFSGDFWSGKSALKLGLVDGLGDLGSVLPKEFKVDAYADYTPSPSLLHNLAGQLGTSMQNLFSSRTDAGVRTEL